MPAPGERFDRFEVEEVLGQGGMATVYRVRHGTLGSHHALKVLDLPFPAIRARLVQEGQVQARLRHPHVVAVTDLIEVEGSPGLIMEYVGGPTLEAWLLGHRPDPATATWLFSGVLDAVAYAHREGLVHRDLKPGNVLLQELDGRLFPKVADFGIAKLLTGTTVGMRTRTGFAMGTPGYMAPEQIRNAKDVDARADIFALGCILYELWCGTRAFTGDDVFAILADIEARRYVDPRAHRHDLPDAVADAIAGSLEPDLDRRFPTCEALRDCLAGGAPAPAPTPDFPATLLPPEPPTQVPQVPGPTLTLDPPRRTVAVAGAAAGLGVVAGGALVAALLCGGAAWWVARDRPPVEPPVTGASTEPSKELAPSTDLAPSTEPAPAIPPVAEPLPPLPERARPGPRAVQPALTPASSSTATPTADPVSPVSVPTVAAPPVATAPTPPVATPSRAEPAADAPGRFSVVGDVDVAWLEARGRRFGQGAVAPGGYTLHVRWGDVEIERKVTVVAGKAVVATCDPRFFDCVVR